MSRATNVPPAFSSSMLKILRGSSKDERRRTTFVTLVRAKRSRLERYRGPKLVSGGLAVWRQFVTISTNVELIVVVGVHAWLA